MRLYVLSYGADRLIAIMDAGKQHDMVFGAVRPGKDGNYYDRLLVFGQKIKKRYSLGAEGYLEFLKDGLANNTAIVSDEFPFDPEDIVVAEYGPIR